MRYFFLCSAFLFSITSFAQDHAIILNGGDWGLLTPILEARTKQIEQNYKARGFMTAIIGPEILVNEGINALSKALDQVTFGTTKVHLYLLGHASIANEGALQNLVWKYLEEQSPRFVTTNIYEDYQNALLSENVEKLNSLKMYWAMLPLFNGESGQVIGTADIRNALISFVKMHPNVKVSIVSQQCFSGALAIDLAQQTNVQVYASAPATQVAFSLATDAAQNRDLKQDMPGLFDKNFGASEEESFAVALKNFLDMTTDTFNYSYPLSESALVAPRSSLQEQMRSACEENSNYTMPPQDLAWAKRFSQISENHFQNLYTKLGCDLPAILSEKADVEQAYFNSVNNLVLASDELFKENGQKTLDFFIAEQKMQVAAIKKALPPDPNEWQRNYLAEAEMQLKKLEQMLLDSGEFLEMKKVAVDQANQIREQCLKDPLSKTISCKELPLWDNLRKWFRLSDFDMLNDIGNKAWRFEECAPKELPKNGADSLARAKEFRKCWLKDANDIWERLFRQEQKSLLYDSCNSIKKSLEIYQKDLSCAQKLESL